MNRRVYFMITATISLCAFSGALYAAQLAFEGKTIRIVVGFSAGGGFDTYSRAIARHMSKHIPGNPAIIVENMTELEVSWPPIISIGLQNRTALRSVTFMAFRF